MKVKILKVRITDEHLLSDQKLVDEFLLNHEICNVNSSFVYEENYWSACVYYEDKKKKEDTLSTTLNEPKAQKYSVEDQELNTDEIKILESLKLWRSEKAKEQNLPVYFIATNKELSSIAKFKPFKKEELQEIKGFGKFKIEHYGSEIIEILEQI
ncbi:HRDC domain-containing protein [Halpernia frigidisoli]|uniref:HRDC domain-containing protein n=1 Tax=Halpernia frigidisoli TaxID=1125876 RepID=A0A1I3F3U4_9FLAO|nr:HRDC domain-containing protein [Halpernia frigidisoli]SFI05820.1 HRDC domain-containing protein [Halpernia frigidisoli]